MVQQEAPTGILFSAGHVVFKNSGGANVQLQEHEDEEEKPQDNLDTDALIEKFPNENSLVHFTSVLTNT